MSVQAYDEEAHLDDECPSSWHPSQEQEQQQALLSEKHEISHAEGSEENGKPIRTEHKASGCLSLLRWWHLVGFVVLFTSAIPIYIRFVRPTPYSNGTKDLKTPHVGAREEYVLDPGWDLNAAPMLREYNWTVTETEYNPDGVFRPMLVINNQFPGPMIEVNSGDTIRVNVQNHMSNSTSFHWHGLYQNGTNWMDGTVGITQCPIAPGGTFTYEFTVENQSGTYWYHAHQGVQSSDGLHGPLIIHSKDERELQRIGYATDRVIMISDHYHDLSSGLAMGYLGPDMENAEPVPDGILINGQAIRDCDDLPHRRCDNTTANVKLPTFSFQAGKGHRLRIINVGAFAEFQFQIDEHELAVTEVDGTDVLPISYHRINVNPAQRYSVVLQTNNTKATGFRMRARMITTCFAEVNSYMASEVHGIVRYGLMSDANQLSNLPESKDWGEAQHLECRDLNTTELVPVRAIAAPATADAFFYLRSNFEIGAYQLSRGSFNGSSWHPNIRSPTLTRAVDGLRIGASNITKIDATGDMVSDAAAFVNNAAFDSRHELVIQSSGITVIDVMISNFDDGSHPMHLHGYKYFVLAQGHGYPPRKSVFDPITRDNLTPLYDSLDLSNPLRRDTASVEAFGWMLLRFVADNPGAWAFHCHISWHTEAGLLMQFLTRTDLLTDMHVPASNRALCDAPGLEKGAGPKDEDYYHD